MKSMRVVMHVRISLSFNNMVWHSKDYRAESEEIRCTLEDLRFACFLSGLVPNTFESRHCQQYDYLVCQHPVQADKLMHFLDHS